MCVHSVYQGLFKHLSSKGDNVIGLHTKNRSWEGLTNCQKQRGPSLLPYIRFYYTHFETFDEYDILTFLLRMSSYSLLYSQHLPCCPVHYRTLFQRVTEISCQIQSIGMAPMYVQYTYFMYRCGCSITNPSLCDSGQVGTRSSPGPITIPLVEATTSDMIERRHP
jgi:hypothetical protein